MCVCPLSIKNNKLDFDPLVDRFYNCVPCGQCYECQESKRNGYEVRSLYEYIYTKNHGGCAFYITLTYNNTFVPKLPGTDLLVASKSDVVKFIKRLRKYLFGYNFKYYIVSEYGGKTFRPHYHGVIYFDRLINVSVFHSALKSAWKFGFVHFGENNGLIKDSRVFNYVSKYVSKDITFSKYVNSIDSSIVKSYYDNDVTFRHKFSLYPFHLQSQKFGLSIVYDLKTPDYVRGYFVQNDIVGLNRKLAIPLYILRYKLYDKFKNTNDTISYRLNDYGIQIFKLKMNHQYKKLCELYDNIVSLALKAVETYYNYSPTAQSLFNVTSFKNYLLSLSVSKTNYIVSYKLLYHDIDYVDFTFKNFFEDLQIFVDHVYKKQWFQFSNGKKYECPFSDEIKFECRIFEEIISHLRYNRYLQDVNNYNRLQYHKCLKTKIIKLRPVLTFNEFINNCSTLNKYKCLNTKVNLKECDPNLSDVVLPESFGHLLMAV